MKVGDSQRFFSRVKGGVHIFTYTYDIGGTQMVSLTIEVAHKLPQTIQIKPQLLSATSTNRLGLFFVFFGRL